MSSDNVFNTWNTDFSMNLLVPLVALVVGFILGVGAMIVYIQYSMYSQMKDLEEHMGDMQNLASGDFDIPAEDIEEKIQKEDKKEERE